MPLLPGAVNGLEALIAPVEETSAIPPKDDDEHLHARHRSESDSRRLAGGSIGDNVTANRLTTRDCPQSAGLAFKKK